MRIERKGSARALTPRVERFLKEVLFAKELDTVQHPEQMRADYSCLHGLLAVEVKTLKEPPAARMENLVNELRQRDDWPIFLGSAPLHSFVNHLRDPEAARLQILERLGRTMISHLRKANKQLAAHTKTFPRKNVVKLVVLINEDHEEYEPRAVGYILHHALTRMVDGTVLYPNIDSVLYITERHALPVEGLVSFPLLSVEGFSVEQESWKELVICYVLEKWAAWTGTPLYACSFDDQQFITIDQIPEIASQQTWWQIEYKKNRYMQYWADDQLRERFDELICIGALAFLKASPFKPSDEVIGSSMREMSHMVLEMAWRATPITDFQHTPERLAAAAGRLGFDSSIVDWLEKGSGSA